MKDRKQIQRQVNRVFDVPFQVIKKSQSVDDDGIVRDEWVTEYSLWADGRRLYGSDYDRARQNLMHKQVKLITRYGPVINEQMRIVLDSEVYEIDNVDNVGFKNEEIEIRCVLLPLEEVPG